MICTLYSHYIGFEKITAILQHVYPKGILTARDHDGNKIVGLTIKGGLFSSNKKIKVTYRQKREPSYQFSDQDGSSLATNLRGLYNYVSSLPSSNHNVKELLLHKIQTINCEFSISQEQGETKEIKSLIEQLALIFDAIVFAQPGTIISQSDGQHFLDERLNLIIDGQGRSSIESLEVKIESRYYDTDQNALATDQISRKADNEALLRNRNIPINSNLPYIVSEQDLTVRTPREIAIRTCVLAVTNFVAFDVIPASVAIDYLQQYNLWPFVTPKEKDFLQDPTDDKRRSETWKSERVWTLLWALGKANALPFPEKECDLNNIPLEDYPVGGDKDPNLFIEAAITCRSPKKLLDAGDLYYRLDWACVDARLQGRQIDNVHPLVVYERHYALNWLIRYQEAEWDDVSCDT